MCINVLCEYSVVTKTKLDAECLEDFSWWSLWRSGNIWNNRQYGALYLELYINFRCYSFSPPILLDWVALNACIICCLGYYQQPEVVEFTSSPRDAVVCQECSFNLSCSIAIQSSSAGEQYVPLPELEWTFNGTGITQVSHPRSLYWFGNRVHTAMNIKLCD